MEPAAGCACCCCCCTVRGSRGGPLRRAASGTSELVCAGWPASASGLVERGGSMAEPAASGSCSCSAAWRHSQCSQQGAARCKRHAHSRPSSSDAALGCLPAWRRPAPQRRRGSAVSSAKQNMRPLKQCATRRVSAGQPAHPPRRWLCCAPPQIFERNPTTVKNYGIWVRYQSRTGYHNAYKVRCWAGHCFGVHGRTRLPRTAACAPRLCWQKHLHQVLVGVCHAVPCSAPHPHTLPHLAPLCFPFPHGKRSCGFKPSISPFN